MANSIVIHMGFLNTPYTKQAKSSPMAAAKAHEKKSRRHYSATKTTEDVADILEDKYGVVTTFLEKYEDEISDLISEKLENFVIKTLSERRKINDGQLFKSMKPDTSQIEKMFRGFLDRDETGVSIKAAIEGRRSGRKIRSTRPPFINTGLYRASFRAWADTK